MSKKIISVSPLSFPWQTKDPFLFCAHHLDHYPSGNPAMGVRDKDKQGRQIGQDFGGKDGWSMYHGEHIPGFPYHPHRGFETITINKLGAVDHSDSLGAAGRFMAGDVQWMTAGSGVQHSEMFPLLNEDEPNPLEIFQIWLNLPKASKMVDPHFKMLWKEDIPVKEITDLSGRKTYIDVIAGNMEGTQAPDPTPDSWANRPENSVAVYTVRMEAGAEWKLPATNASASRMVYFYHGNELTIESEEVAIYHAVELQSDRSIQFRNGSEAGYLLILEGTPIGEPVVQHGPFVMNTREEIQQTFLEYQKTQFGGWPWKEKEKVHGKDVGRFALHADGRQENK